jgi:hypothetical protein
MAEIITNGFLDKIAKYVNFRNALSVALTILITLLVDKVSKGDDGSILKYSLFIILLFVMWCISYIVEKGGVDFFQWLAQFFETKQSNNKEMEMARIAFSNALKPTVETAVCDTYQKPIITDEIKAIPPPKSDPYQKPGG